eukprot:TRINITY_DN6177_c0_g1_i1.p1 TRINITY_DN6177_c0_g1~~TRINITY_DN6177_c0_g1_i1.p1  ORF type:complete len:394 (-),score=12.27 TRINITY_DN6177_c0_g1_i1:153-1334(-)
MGSEDVSVRESITAMESLSTEISTAASCGRGGCPIAEFPSEQTTSTRAPSIIEGKCSIAEFPSEQTSCTKAPSTAEGCLLPCGTPTSAFESAMRLSLSIVGSSGSTTPTIAARRADIETPESGSSGGGGLLTEPAHASPPGRLACLKRVSLILLPIAVIALSFVFRRPVRKVMLYILHILREMGGYNIPLMVFLVAVFSVLALPTFPLMVGSGGLYTMMYGLRYGILVGTLTVFVGLWSGSLIAFQLGRSCCKRRVAMGRTQSPTMLTLIEMVDEHGTKIVFLARLLPVLPAEVFNYACALTSLTLRQYAIGCLSSILPVALWVMPTALSTHEQMRHGGHQPHDSFGLIIAVIDVIGLVSIGVIGCVFYVRVQRRRAASRPSGRFSIGSQPPT